MNINKHFPSIFTLLNLFLGFIAIINIHQENYFIACYILFIAGALDSIDGKLARVFGFSTNFVKEIAKLNGKIDHFVTRSTIKSLKEKYD